MENFDVSLLIDEAIASAKMISFTHNIMVKDHLKERMVYDDRKRIE
jgi:hypothetical protein